MKLTAVYEPAPEGGYTCFVEEVPAAISEGDTLEEAEANLRDALTLVLRCHRELYDGGPVTTPPQVGVPTAPTGLSATVQTPGKGGGISLAWTDRSNNEDLYQVEGKTGAAGIWQLLVTLNINSSKYQDAAAIGFKTTYYYRVRALNTVGPSAYSNEVSATTK